TAPGRRVDEKSPLEGLFAQVPDAPGQLRVSSLRLAGPFFPVQVMLRLGQDVEGKAQLPDGGVGDYHFHAAAFYHIQNHTDTPSSIFRLVNLRGFPLRWGYYREVGGICQG